MATWLAGDKGSGGRFKKDAQREEKTLWKYQAVFIISRTISEWAEKIVERESWWIISSTYAVYY